MQEEFVPKTFKPATMDIIDAANTIIANYQAQGFTLTLRQLFYQFVTQNIIRNKQSEYKRLGSIINDARLAGLIDWDAIEDRTRNLKDHSFWASPSDIIASAAHSYAEDLWEWQEFRPEVWIEKDALIGVIEPVCNRWRIPYFACRGYSSQSEQYSAGKRLARYRDEGSTPVILHLGDHDPSGLDMSRDNEKRLAMFAEIPDLDFRRLALNFGQVQQYNPPPNPAKNTDSRSGPYISRFGNSSWELDALDPKVIDAIIEKEVQTLVNKRRWRLDLAEETLQKEHIAKAAERWDEVRGMLE